MAERECSIVGCRRHPVARGWCSAHYQRWAKTGRVDAPLARPAPRAPALCPVGGCGREVRRQGYCQMHYRRWQKHGDPTVGAAVALHQPVRDSHGYIRVWAPDHPAAHANRVPEHRLVMESIIGRRLLPDENVHHKNGNRADNRPENLELWLTHQPKGARVEDAIAWAREILARYGSDP